MQCYNCRLKQTHLWLHKGAGVQTHILKPIQPALLPTEPHRQSLGLYFQHVICINSPGQVSWLCFSALPSKTLGNVDLVTFLQKIPLLAIFLKEMISMLKRYLKFTFIAVLSQYFSYGAIKRPPMNEWIKQIVHIHNGILLSQKDNEVFVWSS